MNEKMVAKLAEVVAEGSTEIHQWNICLTKNSKGVESSPSGTQPAEKAKKGQAMMVEMEMATQTATNKHCCGYIKVNGNRPGMVTRLV